MGPARAGDIDRLLHRGRRSAATASSVTLSAEVAPTRLISAGTAVPIAPIGTHGSFVTSYSSRPNAKFTPTDRHDKTVLSVSCQAV